MGNPSFDAVKRFQQIREATHVVGKVGDDVTALVKVGTSYRIVQGVIITYRSDAGRIVLDESGKEHSLSQENVRKYTEVTDNGPAHPEYDVVAHFHMIKEGHPRSGYGFNIGETVAALLATDSESKIVFGRLYGNTYDKYGIRYKLVTREGDKYAGISPSFLAKI